MFEQPLHAAFATMGPEFVYNRLDYEIGGADYNVWGLMWRLQRSF